MSMTAPPPGWPHAHPVPADKTQAGEDDNTGIGYFVVSAKEPERRDILFELTGRSPIPDELVHFKDEVEKTLTTLRMLFPEGDKRFEGYFAPLLSLAQAGLVGERPAPGVAASALAALKSEMVGREAGRIKNQYMRTLGKHAGTFAVLTGALAVTLYLTAPSLAILTDFLFLWTGCMAGVWVSFGARKTVLRFEDLAVPEEDRLDPLVRLFFAGILTTILGLLFSTKAIVVSLGAISTDQINNSIRISLLLGLMCGFSEQALSSKVSQQTTRLLDFDKKS